MTHSCIYEGRVRHRRFTPVSHCFEYPIFMMYLDLSELPALFDRYRLWSYERFNLASFRREDHLGNKAQPLDEAVRELVHEKTSGGGGPIRLLTHLRYFGYVFNPVSFYYCFGEENEKVGAVVAEVNNTPWREQHPYVLTPDPSRSPARPTSPVKAKPPRMSFALDKEFHVSPFMDMNVSYRWHFGLPSDRLAVHMENYDGPEKIFDATLRLKRVELSQARLTGLFVRYPLMTAQVFAKIHLQALKLWLKKVPVHTHPSKRVVGKEIRPT